MLVQGLRQKALVAAVTLSLPALVIAQSDDLEDSPASEAIDEIIVTGSRIPRSTYTSMLPLQIISADESREVGLIDTTTILQQSIAAAGFQPERTLWTNWILPGGPGSANISLRGLGGARTLVLINGRRVGAAGVQGAPSEADLSLIPSSLVRQYDLLLDGASSVYGSDAVAGVSNVLLRRDFDGLEISLFSTVPEQDGGIENSISLAWGKEFRRGFVGFGAEFQDNAVLTYGQRRWTAGCARHVEIDEDGRRRHADYASHVHYGQILSECYGGPWVGNIWIDDLRRYTGGIDPGPGAVYYTPGTTNSGIPGWSETAVSGWGVDGDGDGQTDVNVYDYSLEMWQDTRHLHPDFERVSAMAYGEYTFRGELALTPFFELQYAEREHLSDTGPHYFNVDIPPGNPYNPCNPDGLDGVDCAVAWNYFWTQPTVIEQFIGFYGVPPSAFGLDANEPVGPMWVTARVSIEDERNIQRVKVSQARAVVGIRGELPALNRGSFEDWRFELALTVSDASGSSHRPGVRYDWLTESLATSSVYPATGNVACGTDNNGDGLPDGFLANGRPCVPVNMLAPSLYSPLVGDFATQAERDFLFDSRDFATDYRQWLVTGIIGGDLFELPGGPVAAVVGIEYREDKIRSIPDEVARDALLFAYKADGGAVGERFTREAFAEIEVPLLSERPGARDLTLNLSGRYTRDEYYGSDTTYSAKLGWRPVESLLLRATTGTSFRAPNLRENFFVGVTGWLPIPDPCAIPAAALGLLGEYDPARDDRDPHVLQNCRNQGVDPTTLDLAGNNIYATWYTSGGTTALTAETSDAHSYGFVWDQPFSDSFELRVGATYYEIDVANTIITPGPHYVVSECYGDVNLDSTLCERIERDPETQLMTFISADFVNRDELFVSGFDINVAYGQELTLFGREVDLSAGLVLNHPREVSETYIDSAGDVDYEDWAGEWGYPDWHGYLRLGARIGRYGFTWRTRYVGAVQRDPADVDPWSDIYEGGSHTCFGPTEDDVQCRDVGFADDYYTHAASLYYRGDRWTIGGGIRNLFDEPPPEVDDAEGGVVYRNVPRGFGYDVNGRTYFVSVQARF